MKQKPVISVLCLSMNHERFIEKSFHSLVNQTYSNLEIFYADNFSADASFMKGDKILRNSGLPYKSFQREKSYNASQNLNFLLQHATGKYISILSADDWWDPNHLKEKIAYFERNKQYGFVHGSGFLHYYDTGVIELEKVISKRKGWVFNELLQRNFINTIGIVIRKDALDAVGPFDENSPLEDWDMWLRLAEKFELGFLDKPLVYYGKQSANISANKEYMAAGYAYIFTKYSMHPQIKLARKFYEMVDLYEKAKTETGLKRLQLLLHNFDWKVVHFKQLAKAMFSILSTKDTRGTNS